MSNLSLFLEYPEAIPFNLLIAEACFMVGHRAKPNQIAVLPAEDTSDAAFQQLISQL
jgi:hypothetical protein